MQKPGMRNISSLLPLINPQSERNLGYVGPWGNNLILTKQNLISCDVLFYVFLNWDLWIDDHIVHKGDSQNITFINLVQFQVDILGVFFDGFKICFQKKWISVKIDCSKDYSKESNCSVSTEVLWRVDRSNYCQNEKEDRWLCCA